MACCCRVSASFCHWSNSLLYNFGSGFSPKGILSISAVVKAV